MFTISFYRNSNIDWKLRFACGILVFCGLLIVLIDLANLGLEISLIFLGMGFLRFVLDRRELKSAQYYARLTSENQIWKELVVFGVILILVIGLALFLYRNNIGVEQNNGIPYWIFIPIASQLERNYEPFIQSIRSFDLGIKLPGRNQTVVYWKDVEDFRLVDTSVTIVENGTPYHFEIDERDVEDAQEMIRVWSKFP